MAIQTQEQTIPALTSEQWKDIQGFVVYGYGTLPYAKYLFLHVSDAIAAKKWIAKMIDHIMTVQDWNDRVNRDVAVNIAFTHAGFEALGLSEQTLATFSHEFIEGMSERVRARNLGDIEKSAPEHWEFLNPKPASDTDEVHILLMFNGKTQALLDDIFTEAPFDVIGNQTESGVHIVTTQGGSTPDSKKEPFGFRDGISNPWIEGTRNLTYGQKQIIKQRGGKQVVIDLEYDPVIKTGEFILGYKNEYDLLPQTPLVWGESDADLPPVPLSEVPHGLEHLRDFGRNGSYIVYRKLAQDISGYWKYIADQAENDPHEMSKIGAKCVGRWASGVPLVISPDEDKLELAKEAVEMGNNSLINNFHYIGKVAGQGDDDDSFGFGCPVGSHIRRSNARDSLLDDRTKPVELRYYNNNHHRLMRRSVSWGTLPDHQVHEPDFIEHKGAPLEITYNHDHEWGTDEAGAGIHFFAVNANINQQFEFVMQAWTNDGRFNGLYANKDFVIGKNSDDSVDTNYMNIPRKGNYRRNLQNINRFVTVRAGGYFFMPSLRAITYLVNR